VNIGNPGTDLNKVLGNYIGTDVTGTSAIGNGQSGVAIVNFAAFNYVGTDGNGMADDAEGNLISGNILYGVVISDNAEHNVVAGNFIGTDVTGRLALGNGFPGVSIVSAANNTIGGTTTGSRNVISSNFISGVEIIFSGSTGNLVQGNYIGTDVDGLAALGNSSAGIIIDKAPNNTIGGTIAGARNIISGNDVSGVLIINAATGNLIQGNYIGTDVSGTIDLGNTERGVAIGAASNNVVGGTDPSSRNVISGNDGAGVYITLFGQQDLSQQDNQLKYCRCRPVPMK